MYEILFGLLYSLTCVILKSMTRTYNSVKRVIDISTLNYLFKMWFKAIISILYVYLANYLELIARIVDRCRWNRFGRCERWWPWRAELTTCIPPLEWTSSSSVVTECAPYTSTRTAHAQRQQRTYCKHKHGITWARARSRDSLWRHALRVKEVRGP